MHLKEKTKKKCGEDLNGVLGGWGDPVGCWVGGVMGGFGWEKINLLRDIFVLSSSIILCLI